MSTTREGTRGLLLLGLFALGACGAEQTGGIGQLAASSTTYKVAAIQYGGQASKVSPSCTTDVCAIKALVSQAKSQGAILVVAPEHGISQGPDEVDPGVGDDPPSSAQWGSGTLIKTFSQQAKQEQIYLVIHLDTYKSTPAGKKVHSTQVAFGPDGKVVGKHHKFELYGGEASYYTPGTDVMVFDSPLGKVGMLICADIYGDLELHAKMAHGLGARVVAFSSLWTVGGAPNWQASFAKNWGVYFVGSNITGSSGGGGIFDPQGTALDKKVGSSPSLAIATIPAP